jgi:hypothetical protein
MKADVETRGEGRASDEAVKSRTGKTWAEWFAILDARGARRWTHREIAAHLHDAHGCPPWWSQMVTVAYEQARGLREKHETPTGYQVSRSKTVGVPLSRLFDAWQNARVRSRWLGGVKFAVRKATRNKSLRITWEDGRTSVEVLFYPKGGAKSQVTVQHAKLADAAAAERMKAYWGERLDLLQATLEPDATSAPRARSSQRSPARRAPRAGSSPRRAARARAARRSGR